MSERSWETLTGLGETFTCYSAAISAWAVDGREDWRQLVNPGLWLALVPELEPGLFGFGHFPPGLRARLGLVRTGAESVAEGLPGVTGELARSGRVIVAGDGFNLPWHVAYERRHVPHWFVLRTSESGPVVIDPFACRNELGNQAAWAGMLDDEALGRALQALPSDDRVAALRERLAFGDDAGDPGAAGCQWFVAADAGELTEPGGLRGPEAIRVLAAHFRERGGEPAAYAQADDIWSIARHRAFLCAHAASLAADPASSDAAAGEWARDHGEGLAKRWGHMAPLIMQATLALRAGRVPSTSVADTLTDLADREQAASQALPDSLAAVTITGGAGARMSTIDPQEGADK